MKKGIILVIICIVLTSCFQLENQDKNISIGEEYLYSYNWDKEDPFEEIKIDTVIILDIRGIYVKWRPYDMPEDFFHSGEVKYLKNNIRNLDYKR
jgi:hypothetical protein